MAACSIWKYPLEATDTQVLEMPKGATILCCQIQNGIPCLWVLVGVEISEKVSRTILTRGTGQPLASKDIGMYIGTYQLQGGGLVFHVFEQW